MSVDDGVTPDHRIPIDALLAAEYGVEGAVSRLGGQGRNYRVDGEDGCWILKVAGPDDARDGLDLEHAAVEHLSACAPDLAVPRTVPTRAGRPWAEWTSDDGVPHAIRLLRFVPGTSWGEAGAPGMARLSHLGGSIARMERALAGFSHPAADRTHRWDLTHAGDEAVHVPRVADPADRRRLEWLFHLWRAIAVPLLPGLPRTFIHADANDENILVDGDRVIGFLDFGDALRNPSVCELAIALAYVIMDTPDPLAAGAAVVAGFDAVRALEDAELDVLFPLLCGRLAQSVAIAADRRRIDPDHPTWFVSEEPAWRLIRILADIDPADARRRLVGETRPQDVVAWTPTRELLERRRGVIGSALSIAYDEPIHMVRGAGPYLHDHRGRPFLDLVNNVCHVGHCHPHVVDAGQRAMARLNTNTRYLYDGLTDYAERLVATLPDPLRVCFFVNSGTEANELALRLVQTHTGRRDVVVVDGAYHGHTARLIDMSPYKFTGPGGSGSAPPWVHVVPVPDGYRGIHRGQDRATGEAYGEEVGRAIALAAEPIAAFFTESLLSCAGQIVPPPGWLETAFRHVREAGGLCVVDEVQVGFGRVGSHFWGFERQDVVPDVVVLGKPIGNGHPMGAVVTTPDVAASFANGMEFFSTFGGNPVSCAIGMAVLDVIDAATLQMHAQVVGAHFLDGLRELAARHPRIGDVRGAGLFIGIELVQDRGTREPAADAAAVVIERMKERGMLLSTDGPHHNVIKIKPPMVIATTEVDMVLRALDDILAEVG